MADTYDATKHDIGIKYSGTMKGLMLAQEEYMYNGVKHTRPVYQTLIDEYIADQQATGQLGYEHLPPEKELSFVQSSHRSGFGQEFYDPADPERYNTSIGMDLRFKGMAIMSNQPTAITTLPRTDAKTILNSSFESWNGSLNNWTLVDATLNKVTAGPNDGTNYVQLDGSSGYIWQELNTDDIQGRRFTFTAYGQGSTATKARIAIYDGTTTWYSSFAGTSWTALSVTATLGADASVLQIRCVYAGGGLANFDGAMTITRPTHTNPTAHCLFNDIQYVAFGPLLTKEDDNGDEFEAVYEFASPISDMHVFSDGYMYIAQEATTVIEDCENAWTAPAHGWTTSTLDTGDYKVGSGSVKFVYNGGGATGVLIAYKALTLDATTFEGVKLWIKADIAVAANDLHLFFSEDNDASGEDDQMALPALVAGQWAQVWMRQADPASNSRILSIGLEYNANEKANTLHIDAVRAANSYWYMDSGENFTQSTLNVAPHDSFAKFFHEVGATMWKSLPPHRVFSSTDPSNTGGANWSGATIVDTPTHEITGLESDGESLYIGKEDRTFYLDSLGAVKVLIGETTHMHTAASGKNLFVWKSKVYAPAGAHGLVEYDAGTITWRSPSRYSTRIATFNGTVQALAGDEEWLFAIIENDPDSTVEILAGRSEVIRGTTRWVWHPLTRITLTSCEIAFVTNDYQKRLYIGSTTSGNAFYYIPLPENYGDIVNDANIDVPPNVGTSYFITPKIHYNFRDDLKTAIKITVELGHANDSLIYFECWIKMGDGGWVDAGNLKGDANTRIATLYFAANTTDRNFQVKFVGRTDVSTKTPILLWYDIRAILYPQRRNLIACTVRVADNIRDGGNPPSTMSTTAAEIRTMLEAARDATYPVDFEDLWSNAKKVRVLALKGQPFSTVHKQAKGENIEEHFHLLLQEVKVSA